MMPHNSTDQQADQDLPFHAMATSWLFMPRLVCQLSNNQKKIILIRRFL